MGGGGGGGWEAYDRCGLGEVRGVGTDFGGDKYFEVGTERKSYVTKISQNNFFILIFIRGYQHLNIRNKLITIGTVENINAAI